MSLRLELPHAQLDDAAIGSVLLKANDREPPWRCGLPDVICAHRFGVSLMRIAVDPASADFHVRGWMRSVSRPTKMADRTRCQSALVA